MLEFVANFLQLIIRSLIGDTSCVLVDWENPVTLIISTVCMMMNSAYLTLLMIGGIKKTRARIIMSVIGLIFSVLSAVRVAIWFQTYPTYYDLMLYAMLMIGIIEIVIVVKEIISAIRKPKISSQKTIKKSNQAGKK